MNQLSSNLFKKEIEVSDIYQLDTVIQMYHQIKSVLIQQPTEQNTIAFYQSVINLQQLFPYFQRIRQCKSMFTIKLLNKVYQLESPLQEVACAFYNICNIISKDNSMPDETKALKIGFYSNAAASFIHEGIPIFSQITMQNKIAQCGLLEYQIEMKLYGDKIQQQELQPLIPDFTGRSSTQQTNENQQKLQDSTDPLIQSQQQQMQLPQLPGLSQIQSTQSNQHDSQIQQVESLPQIPSIIDNNQQSTEKLTGDTHNDVPNNISNNIDNAVSDNVSQPQQSDKQSDIQPPQTAQIDPPQQPQQQPTITSQAPQQAAVFPQSSQQPSQPVTMPLQPNQPVTPPHQIAIPPTQPPHQVSDPLIITTQEQIEIVQVNGSKIAQIYQYLHDIKCLPDNLQETYQFYMNLNLILILYTCDGNQKVINQIFKILRVSFPQGSLIYSQIYNDFKNFILSEKSVDTELKEIVFQDKLPEQITTLQLLPIGFQDTLNMMMQDYTAVMQYQLQEVTERQQKLEKNHQQARQYISTPQSTQLSSLKSIQTQNPTMELQTIENAQLDRQNLLNLNQQAQNLYQAYRQLMDTDNQQIAKFQQRWNSVEIRNKLINNVNGLVQYAKQIQELAKTTEQINMPRLQQIKDQIIQLQTNCNFNDVLAKVDNIKYSALQTFDNVTQQSRNMAQQWFDSLTKVQTVEQIKQYILQNVQVMEQLQFNKRSAIRDNVNVIIGSINGTYDQQLQQLEQQLQQIYQNFYQQLQQVMQDIQESQPILKDQDIKYFYDALTISQNVIQKAGNVSEFESLQQQYNTLRNSYQQQMQGQWAYFCQGGQIILK